MARYAIMYEEECDKRRKLETKLVRLDQQKEDYRMFINETGRAQEFLLWWGKRAGLSSGSMETLFEATTTHQTQERTP